MRSEKRLDDAVSMFAQPSFEQWPPEASPDAWLGYVIQGVGRGPVPVGDAAAMRHGRHRDVSPQSTWSHDRVTWQRLTAATVNSHQCWPTSKLRPTGSGIDDDPLCEIARCGGRWRRFRVPDVVSGRSAGWRRDAALAAGSALPDRKRGRDPGLQPVAVQALEKFAPT
jgi:hypothetical protein